MKADQSETVSVELAPHEWVRVGACMSHALETGASHPAMDLWADTLRAVVAQVEQGVGRYP